MTAGEKMLTLQRELFADDCEMDTYMERYNNRNRELREEGLKTGTWDTVTAQAKKLGEDRRREWARHEKFQEEGYGELQQLRAETSPDELTPEQLSEIVQLAEASLAMSQRRLKEAQKEKEQAVRWLDGGPPPTL